MALTREPMTDEQRKSVALECLKAFDNGGVTSTGGSILDLFADEAQVYFPKWGLATIWIPITPARIRRGIRGSRNADPDDQPRHLLP